jgi:hypothetical protein
MLLGEKPLPWENLPSAERKRLGEFRKPVLQLLNRNPDQRPSMSQFYANCNAIFFSNTTTKIGDALTAPPEASPPLATTTAEGSADCSGSTPESGTATSVATRTSDIPTAASTPPATTAAPPAAVAGVNVQPMANSTASATNTGLHSSRTQADRTWPAGQSAIDISVEVPPGLTKTGVNLTEGFTDFATLPFERDLKIV